MEGDGIISTVENIHSNLEMDITQTLGPEAGKTCQAVVEKVNTMIEL